METYKTIKQYAEYAGVTPQSVYRRLQTEQNARALEGHITRKNGSTYLDEYAIQYLDDTRKNTFAGSPAAQQERLVTELAAKAQGLQEENDALREKLLDALQRLTEATRAEAEQKVALADVRARLRLLEAQSEAAGELLQEHKEQARQKAEEAARLREDLDQARDEVHRLRLDTAELDQLRNELREAEDEAEGFREKYQGAGEEISRLQADLEEAADRDLQYQVAAAEAKDRAEEYREECLRNANTIDELNAEIKRLQNRGFWARLFNK